MRRNGMDSNKEKRSALNISRAGTRREQETIVGAHHSSSTRLLPPPPKPGGLRGAFELRSARYPWRKALAAALGMGIALLIGAALGHVEWGLVTSMGGFTALYVHDEPYAQRAMKLGIVAVGLAVALAVGTVSAVSPWSMALALGLVSAVATFLTAVWRVPPPSSYFFILTCAVGTGLPVDPAAAPLRAGLALLGGGIAWLIGMSGWIVKAHAPETAAVAKAYRAVAAFLSAIGTPHSDAARFNATLALRAAEDVVTAGELRWRATKQSHVLFRLMEKANAVFLAGIELSIEKKRVNPELPAALQALADGVLRGHKSVNLAAQDLHPGAGEKLYAAVSEAVSTVCDDIVLSDEIRISRPKVGFILATGFDSNALVLPAALRIGIAVVGATVIATLLGNPRPYWVPLTCASVLQGATILATVQRTIQRAIGTIMGLLVGGAIFSLQPTVGKLAIIVMVLQFVVEMIIVRNYLLAVIFITPMPLILAEIGRAGMTPMRLIHARLLDTLLGCAIGLASVYLLWHRSSSVRLPAVLTAVIRREGDLLQRLFSGRGVEKRSLEALQRSVLNLRTVYDSALSEFPRRKSALEPLWSVIVATQRIGYLILALSKRGPGRALTPDLLQHLTRVFEELAKSAQSGTPPAVQEIRDINGYPTMREELCSMREGLEAAQGRF